MEFASSYGLSAEGVDAFRRLLPQPASEGTASGRAILDRAIVQIPDVTADPAYGAQSLAQTVTYRSIVAVADSKEWEGKPDKLQYFSPNPGSGD
jgi:hypothetical protein